MKIKTTLTALSLLILGFLLMNNSQGPGYVQEQDRTESPLSTGSCNTAGCHDGGNFDPSISLRVFDATFTTISEYEPEEKYQLEITINAGSGTPVSYGFQAVPLDSDNSYAGFWAFFPNPGHEPIVFPNGITYMEHTEPLTSNIITTTIWTAPPAGSGDVTFYVGALAANGNGNNAGDGGAEATITLSEGFMTSSKEVAGSTSFSVFPNPAQDFITIKTNSQISGQAQLKILDITGKVLQAEALEIHQGENAQRVDIGQLNNGLYLLHLVHDDQVITESIVKM